MRRNIKIRAESWPAKIPFRISNHVWDDFPCIVCEIEQDGLLGRGEALGVYYLDETSDSMAAELEAIIPELEAGANRQRLLELLPPGGARMAADAALWDLEAQIAGRSVWSMAGVDEGHEIFWRAVTAGSGIVAGYLIAPGAVVRVLGDGQQFDMGIPHIFDVGHKLLGQLPIG